MMDLLVVRIVCSSFLLIVNFDSGNSFSYFWFDNTRGYFYPANLDPVLGIP
jgi:hypothetical protein